MDWISTNMFYINIIIFASIAAYLSQEKISKRGGNKFNISLLILSYVILTVPVAFRYYTGADYGEYVSIYKSIEAGGLSLLGTHNVEIGYAFLNYICSKIFNHYQSVFIIMAMLTNLFFFRGILYEKNKINLGLAVFVYGFTLYFWGYIQIRNMLGIAIIFYGIRFLIEKKIHKFFIVVTISTLFHSSLSIFFILGVIYSSKFEKIRLPLSYIIILSIPILPQIISLVSTYLVGFSIFSKYHAYVSNIYISISSYFMLNSFPLIIFLLTYKRMKKINKNTDLYLSLYIISVTLLLFSDSFPLLTRFIYALWPSQMILFPTLVKALTINKNRYDSFLIKLICSIGIFIYGMIYIVFYINQEVYSLIPYQSIWMN